MATATFVSIQEYLGTGYSPDREYIEGTVLERNVGEYDHARLQTAIASYLYSARKRLGIRVVVEQRVQVAPTRYRIPDVCVALDSEPEEQVFTRPPFICIEILSKDDRMSEMQERIDDYLAFGVPYVWVINPRTRKAQRCTPGATQEVSELRTENPEIVAPLAELFE